ncbi:DGAT1B [Symbiodinium sp. KB8]|nr:DGAT1B [Symbiodinium sp. KB8]
MAGSMAAAQALAAREQQLAGIAQQLASVVQELRQLPPTVPDATPGLPGVEQGLASVSLQRASSTASASDTDQESRAKTRPSFYPHMPTKRRALLDGLESRSANEILDALKLDDYSGFYNLSMLLLGFSLVYMVLRNVSEKGLGMSLDHFTCPEQARDAALVTALIAFCLAVSLLVFAALRGHVKGQLSRAGYLLLYALVQCIVLGVPIAVLYNSPTGPLPSAMAVMVAIVLCLKLHSYVATNLAMASEAALAPTDSSQAESEDEGTAATTGHVDSDDECDAASGTVKSIPTSPALGSVPPPPDHLQPYSAASVDGSELTPHPRGEGRKRRQGHVRRFPANVTLGNFLYFLAAPTLVYEPAYPRTRRIRRRVIFGHAAAMCVCLALQYFLFTQFLLPVLAAPPEGRSPVLDLMKLAVPSMALWLAGFWSIFHSWLNIVGELTRFGDRRFYKAWYNASTVARFWSEWNQPVHECVAFKTLRVWFFGGMLLQIPLIAVSQGLRGTRRGNFVVWLSLFLGQPLLEMLYIREFLAGSDGNFFCVPG